MNSGIYTAYSGLKAQMTALDLLSNNLANMSTTGFKEERSFFTVLKQSLANGKDGSVQAAVNNHAVASGGTLNLADGNLQHTGRTLDLALAGNGFLSVETTRGIRYTRNGNLTVNANRELATHDGSPVLGEKGKIVLGSGEVLINEQGEIFVDNLRLDRLRIVAFERPLDLMREGNSFLTVRGENPTHAAGGAVTVRQGFLEQSNVNPVTALVRMMEILRQFESIQKSMQIEMNEMNARSIERLGR